MPVQQAFKSSGQASVALAGTAAITTAQPIPGGGENVLIINTTNAAIACDFQGATFSATVSSPIIVPAGARHVATIGQGSFYGSAIGITTATGNVFFFRGDGSTY